MAVRPRLNQNDQRVSSISDAERGARKWTPRPLWIFFFFSFNPENPKLGKLDSLP